MYRKLHKHGRVHRFSDQKLNTIEKQFGQYWRLMLTMLELSLIKCRDETPTTFEWRNYLNSAYTAKSVEPIALRHSHRYNIAYQSMYGLELFHKGNYNKAIEYLQRCIYQMHYYHPYLCCALADALYCAGHYKSCFLVLKSLTQTDDPFHQFTDRFMFSCCIEPFWSDILGRMSSLASSCWSKASTDTTITSKRLRKLMLFDEYYVNSPFTTCTKRLIEIVGRLISFKYWNNDYLSVFQYINQLKSLMQASQKQNIMRLPVITPCFLSLLMLNEWDLCEKLLENNINCIAKCGETLMYSKALKILLYIIKSEWCNATSVNIDANSVHQLHSWADPQLQQHLLDPSESSSSTCFDVMTILGTIDAHLKYCEDALYSFCMCGYLRIGRHHCDNVLCLSQWLFLYSFAVFMDCYMRDINRAKYLCQLAMRCNPLDSSTHLLYSMLMVKCGKLNVARKHWKKSRRLNKRLHCLFVRNEVINEYNNVMISMELETSMFEAQRHCQYVFEICNYCGVQGQSFKKCSSCRAAYYCSIKCQKCDWKREHRDKCSHVLLSKYSILCNKLRTYIERIDFELVYKS
eukprot:947361_1